MSDSEDDIPPVLNPAARYEELLRPCRDLAANWNVDIVAKLSEYLGELDIDFTSLAPAEFADAQINFQHAALVVEGGTCVYSRKVDYLYGLVFAAADVLFESRGKALPSRKARSVPGECDPDGTPTSDDLTFLLLDDELEGSQPSREGITLPLRDLTDNRALLRARDANRLVSVPLHLLPPGPQNSRRASSANQNTTGLRMPDATINVFTGALILDGIGVGDDEDEPLPSDTRPGFENGDSREDEPAINDDDDDHHFGGDSALDDNEALPPAVDNSEHVVEDHDASKDVAYRGLQAPAPPTFAELPPASRRSEPTAPPPDPFLPLDPHDPTSIPSKPVQKGKTWRRPRNSVAGKIASKGIELPPNSLLEIVLGLSSHEFGRKTNRFVSFSAGEEQFKQNMRSIGAAKRRRMKADKLSADESDCDDGGQEEAALLSLAKSGLPGEDADLDLSADDGEIDCGTGFFDGDSDIDDGFDNSGGAEVFPDFEDLANSGMDSSHTSRGQFNDGNERRIEQIAASYEEACRQYLLESSILWQEHAADTQLERRVSDWRSRIEPLLFLEEERAAFDIKQYGDGIMERFNAKHVESNSCESDMRTLFAAKESFEVCRNFLAALQLVNSYKIGIIPDTAGGEDSLNPRVSLLVPSQEVGSRANNVMFAPVSPPSKETVRMPSKSRARTPSKEDCRTPPRQRPQPLRELSENVANTPNRQHRGKRNRQAGSTPASARRAHSRSRHSDTAVK